MAVLFGEVVASWPIGISCSIQVDPAVLHGGVCFDDDKISLADLLD